MIRGWKDEIADQYIAFLRQSQHVTPADLAARFGVPERTAVYWLTDLAREGRVRILGFELVQQDETSRSQRPGEGANGDGG
jgi:hypothetical protein